MIDMFTAAAVQMTSGAEVAANLASAARLIAQAAAAGAALVALPENFAFLGRHERDKLAVAEADGAGPIQDFLVSTAARHNIHLVGGTIPLRGADPQRVRAACLLFGPDGRRLARYDKIHLFDVNVGADGGERYRESASIEPGADIIAVDTDLGRLGLAVCYDLRFPELYRRLAAAGAEVLCVPSAFTQATGRAHWEVLLRARAIENQCFVIAPGQEGEHPGGRRTWGHSLIADPWGEVLALCETGEGMACAELSREKLLQVRQSFPALRHRRFEF
jgi:nitrilase